MTKSKTGRILMVLGFLLVVLAFALSSYNIWDEQRADSLTAGVAQVLKAEVPSLAVIDPRGELIPNYVLDEEREMPTIIIDGEEYIGYVDIPSLGLSLPVLSEWSYPGLKISPCRYVGSVYKDNMVIAAHNYKKHFGGIKNLNPKDIVTFTDIEGNIFTYEVLLIEELQPTQVKSMCEGDWDLTLFTCTLGGRSRVTVRCRLISENL